MTYRIFFIISFCFLFSCTEKNTELKFNKNFKHYSNKGFALIYDDNLLKRKIVNKKLNNRSLLIFNNNLSIDTKVKITNLLNGKYIFAEVGKNSLYPLFYNSVVSKRISEELELNNDEPYIKIQTINSKNSFIANRAKTFKEEKNVANKAPVENITIKNIGINNLENKKKSVKFLSSDSIFLYVIKIADFYFRDSADMLINRLSGDHNIQEIKIKKLSKNSYRVYTGPFKNLDSLKKAYNNIMKLNFENIEIIKL